MFQNELMAFIFSPSIARVMAFHVPLIMLAAGAALTIIIIIIHTGATEPGPNLDSSAYVDQWPDCGCLDGAQGMVVPLCKVQLYIPFLKCATIWNYCTAPILP